MKTILFLYSLDNQHSADLPFHITCYWCRLQLAKFAAGVAWTDSNVFNVSLHFVPTTSHFKLAKYAFDILCNDLENLFFNVMYFLLVMN